MKSIFFIPIIVLFLSTSIWGVFYTQSTKTKLNTLRKCYIKENIVYHNDSTLTAQNEQSRSTTLIRII